VEGDVSLDGTPIPAGTISLEPVGGDGPSTGGTITAGHYKLLGNAAPLPGKKLVRIFAGRKTGRKIPASMPAPPGTLFDEYKQYIPDIYNTHSKLTCEVVCQGSNQIDFRLKSP
jgi:hypothetical protein